MRLLRFVVTSVFFLCLLSGCGDSGIQTDTKDVTLDRSKNPGTGNQSKIEKPVAPELK